MSEEDYVAWVNQQRQAVEVYLTEQGISNPFVGPWPAFDVAPHFAIWAVESQKVAGKIGWWAFSGDCPTDYVSEDGTCTPRNALELLLTQWSAYIPYLKQGKQPPNAKFADNSSLRDLGELLEKRVRLLRGWLADDDLWEER